jgi:hypothetical protein
MGGLNSNFFKFQIPITQTEAKCFGFFVCHSEERRITLETRQRLAILCAALLV